MSEPLRSTKLLLLLLAFFLTSQFSKASSDTSSNFNPTDFIMHHIADGHSFHVYKDFHVPLPVILYGKGGLDVFMSSEFHEGQTVKANHGEYILYHNEIYFADENGSLSMDDENHPNNEKPLDLSITKNVFTMLVVSLILVILFVSAGSGYKKGKPSVPKGAQRFLEPLVTFIRDEIAIPNIGEAKYKKFMPYLLTVFFFIWGLNLTGLIPFFPGGANVTGNISITFTLAFFTLIVTNFNAGKDYWLHIVNTPGVPWWLKIPIPILPLVEFIGVLSKPFALMIRLFANITAGHIIVLSLVSLIFIFKSLAVAPVSIGFVLFMDVLELLVAALQAYVFTMLSALFIGMAVQEHH